MRNVVFISPNFPTNYWQFCQELKNNGMNVLGVGDQPYGELLPELKANLTEYYRVDNLEDYDQVYRAVAYFIFKYGRIDFLESNNEYWLEQDARLRTDFHITTGFQLSDIPRIKYKSKMKEYYHKAGIRTARYHLVSDAAGCQKFLEKVGYPVVVKPDNGVGAAATYKLTCDEDLVFFMDTYVRRPPSHAALLLLCSLAHELRVSCMQRKKVQIQSSDPSALASDQFNLIMVSAREPSAGAGV